MNRIGNVAREYWWELLIGAMLIAGIVQLVVEHDSPGAPTSTLWFQIPALVPARAAALHAPALSVRRPGRILGAGRAP